MVFNGHVINLATPTKEGFVNNKKINEMDSIHYHLFYTLAKDHTIPDHCLFFFFSFEDCLVVLCKFCSKKKDIQSESCKAKTILPYWLQHKKGRGERVGASFMKAILGNGVKLQLVGNIVQ